MALTDVGTHLRDPAQVCHKRLGYDKNHVSDAPNFTIYLSAWPILGAMR